MSEFTPGAPGSPPTERVADAPAGVEPVGASADDDEQLTRAELEAELATLRAAVEVGAGLRAPGAVDQADDVVELPDVDVGDWVTVAHRDPYAGAPVDVDRFGQVVRVVELGTGPAVVVAWVDGGVSDPIPLDHRVHGRADAPRVEPVGA